MSNDTLKEKFAAYQAKVDKALAKFPERKNLMAERLCTPLDIEGFDYEQELGFPSEYPYTRGVQPTMYRGRLNRVWCNRSFLRI
jgi:methylmalonyl-CoA mutase N-terminal domain/subunit